MVKFLFWLLFRLSLIERSLALNGDHGDADGADEADDVDTKQTTITAHTGKSDTTATRQACRLGPAWESCRP